MDAIETIKANVSQVVVFFSVTVFLFTKHNSLQTVFTMQLSLRYFAYITILTNLLTMGSVVSKDGGTDEDVKSRINKARHAFNTLRPIWNSSALSLHNKIRIFNTNVKCVLLYGSETWRSIKSNIHKLQTFINRCLRNIINIRWPDVISNTDLWDKTGQSPIEVEISKRKWGVDRPHTQEVPLKRHQGSP